MASIQEPFGQLLAQHAAFLAQAGACIRADIIATQDKEYSFFVSLLLNRIQAHEKCLQAVEQMKHNEEGNVQWGPIRVSRDDQGPAGIALTIQGPAAGDQCHISVESSEAAIIMESRIRQYDRMSKALARAYSQEQAILELMHSSNEARNQRACVDADQTRIALLKQYNDLRDLAQQLIGIVADGRSVPVRNLYTDGAGYGVGPED